MKRVQPICCGILMVLWATCAARAQAPNEMYMQGTFLQNDGVTPVVGAHGITVVIYTNGSTALSLPKSLTNDIHGVADFVLADSRLPSIFQSSTNPILSLGGPLQSFVTAPYAFQSANLPQASGNFTVGGNLSVGSNAYLAALTADNGGTLATPVNVGGYAVFTNVSAVVFNAGLNVAGGVMVEGVTEANYQTLFTNPAATSVFYGDSSVVVQSNAVVQSAFTIVTNNFQASASSGTAPCDGFLMVWVKVTGHKTSGVNVQVGSLTFKVQYYADACQASQNLNMYTGSTYPVPQGTAWSVQLADAGDSGSISIKCYWVPLRGDG